MKFENKLFILVMILHISTMFLAFFQLRAAMYMSLAAFIIAVLGWNYSVTLEQRGEYRKTGYISSKQERK